MPGRERDVVEWRKAFIREVQRGKSMTALCREFGVSRATGYRWLRRFREEGVAGLRDRANAPRRPARGPRSGSGTREIIGIRSEIHPAARKTRA